MTKVNNIEEFNHELDTRFYGKGILVGINVLIDLFTNGGIINAPENRRADESKWNFDNYRNFWERIYDEYNNFGLYGAKDGYVGLMEPITIRINEDEKPEVNDGMHRGDAFIKLGEFAYSSLKSKVKDLPRDSFFRILVEDCNKGVLSANTKKILENTYVLVRFTNDNKIHYVGVNSAKTMKAQQKNRAKYSKNEIFAHGQEYVMNNAFNLTAVGNVASETSSADTISLMAFAGGDFKANRAKTAEYVLDKYKDKKSIQKFKRFYDKFSDTFSSNFEHYKFVFSDGKFRSIYMYGLIAAARDTYIDAYCKKIESEGLDKNPKRSEELAAASRSKDTFFEILKGTIAMLNSSEFSEIVNRALPEIEDLYVDSNGTGSFSRGEKVRITIMENILKDETGIHYPQVALPISRAKEWEVVE